LHHCAPKFSGVVIDPLKKFIKIELDVIVIFDFKFEEFATFQFSWR